MFGDLNFWAWARESVRASGSGIRANPAAVAAAREVGTNFGEALTEAAPQFAAPFERAADAAVSWSWAVIALAVAFGLAAIAFLVLQVRKAFA